MATQGQAHIKVTADISEAKVRLQQMQTQLKNTGKTADDVSSSIQGAFQKIGSAMAVGLSVAGLQQFTNQLIRTRGEFQQLEIAFGTMLGSTEKADALMKQLIQTAAKTPFDMQGIANGAKQLLAYGTASEEVNDTLIKLGDIAAGLSLPLGDLVYLYGTTMAQGRMFTMDLRQMQGRGIPIADEIAKIMNVSKQAVPEMVTAGKVTAEIFSQAIKNMASEGGKFYNLMEKQSASLTGQISNLEDAIAQMFNEIGKSSEDFLSSGISAVSFLVENYKYLGAALTSVVSAYGAHKAAQMTMVASYNAEAKVLRELTQAKEDDLAEDLKKSVQWGVLTQEQAEEINLMRQKLQVELEVAKEEDRIAGDRLANAQKEHQLANENLILAQDEVDSLNEKIIVAQQAEDIEELSNLQTQKASALEALNTAQTELNTSAENLNTASKAKNTTAQQVSTAQTAVDTAATNANTTAKAVLTKAVRGLKAQIVSMGKALMANPLFLLASVVLGVVGAISSFVASLENEEEQQSRLNEEHQKFIDQINEEKKIVNQSIDVLNDKTASIDKQAIAYRELQKYVSELAGMSMQEYLSLSPKEQKAIQERYEALKNEEIEQEKLNGLLQNYKDQQNKIFNKKGREAAWKLYTDEIKERREKEEVVLVANMKPEEQIKYYEKQIEKLQQQQVELEYLGVEWRELETKILNAKNTIESIKKPQIEINSKSVFDNKAKELKTEIEGYDINVVKAYNEWVEQGGSLENQVFNGKDQIKNFKQILEIAEKVEQINSNNASSAEYDKILKGIKANDPKEKEKRLEELKKLQQKAIDEQYAYETKLIQDKYKLIDEEEKKQLKAINEEEKEYNKKNGATAESRRAFNDRRNTIRLNATFDREQLDKEFKQWKDDFERNNEEIKFNIDVEILKQQLEITDDINEKLDIQKQLRDKLIQKQKDEIELEKRKEILERFGETELNAYLAGTSTNAQVKSIAESYDKKSQLTVGSMMFSDNTQLLTAKLDKLEQYANGVIEIETDLAEKRKAIERGETRGDVSAFENWANIKKDNLLEQLGIDNVPEELSSIVQLTTATTIEELQTQMGTVTAELERLKAEGEIELELAKESGDPEKIANAQNKIATATRLSNTAMALFIKQGDKIATLTPKWDKFSKSAQEASIIISGVTEVIGEVEEAFGDLLSDGAKDAIEVMKTISGVATGLCNNQMLVAMAAGESISAVEKASVILAIISAAVQVISAITNAIVKNFSAKALFEQRMAEYEYRIERLLDLQDEIDRKYQDKTGVDYWDAMSNSAHNYAEEQLKIENLEYKLRQAKDKYNRLLSNYGSGFVTEAKLQNAKDDVEELTELIDNVGVDSALRQAELAMKRAEAEYERIKINKGSDSKAAKEALETLKEAENVYYDILDTQSERIQDIVEQMATTTVTSLGETMASALVDAFSNGLGGMQKAWDDTINDLIKSMLEQRLALQLMDQFEDAFKYLEDATKVETKRYLKTGGRNGLGGGSSLEYVTETIGEATLTDEEIATFIEKMNSAKNGVMSLGEAYQQAMAELGLLDDNIDAETKGFQTMSQDTADELNGRFTALQISGAGIQMSAEGIATRMEDVVRINAGIQITIDSLRANSDVALQIAQRQFEQLEIIANNTAMLNETNSRLKNIQDNTSRL